jgi:hypothetical protein
MDLSKILDFIDGHTLDPQLYWQIPLLYDSAKRYEVQWCGPRFWRFKPAEHVFWYECTTQELVTELNRHQLDLVTFHTYLANSAMEQIVAAQFIIKAGRDVFGDELIDRHVEAYQKFQDQLLDTVEEVLKIKKKEEKAKLKVLKDDE